MERVVVVGAGLAGARTVEELRARGYAGQLTLVGAEPHPPYDRPPLTKAVLRGDADDTTLRPSYADLDVELRLGEIAVALSDGVVETDRARLDFDRLVVAAGAAPVSLDGARTLRTVDDARRLRAALVPGARVVIAGAGWIGAEVATAAAGRGCDVTVVEAAAAPLAAAVGAEVGAATARWYAEAGVTLRCHASVAAIDGAAVHLADGTVLPADVVLVAIGVRPATGWLGLGGAPVETDDRLRAPWPGVFAAGDVAAWPSARFGVRLRVEHWDNALHAPAAVAANLLGGDERYDPVPYFWSEQFGRTMQYAGWHGGADAFVWRGDPTARSWTGCWLRGGVLEALVAVDRPRDLLQARRGIAGRAEADVRRLADPTIPLRAALSS